MLNNTHKVINLGLNGRTVTKQGDYPYWNEDYFKDVMSEKHDIIIFMLGTNDSKKQNWNEEAFKTDYKEMVTLLRKQAHKIYVMIPPALLNREDHEWRMMQSVINEIYPKLIPTLCKEMSLPDS